jgi:hypothetical protein
MTTVIWSTESVDTSAMLLAQTLDDVLFAKGVPNDGETFEAVKDSENQIIFYGVVKLPDWFVDHYLNEDRMFNNPLKTASLLRRNNVMERLSLNGVQGMPYYKIREDTTFTSLREKLGRRFDLVVRAGMTVTHTVDNSSDFNEVRNNVHFACRHVEPVKRIRAFMGMPDITDGGLIGITLAEKRKLSFFEQLTFGSSSDARQHIADLFQNGTLDESMGEGNDLVAWTEDMQLPGSKVEEGLAKQLQNIAQIMHSVYKIDFWSVDVVLEASGNLIVTNMTASPSLQNDTVLDFVSSYYKELLMYGRKMNKDRLLNIIKGMSENQIENAASLLRKEGVLSARA